MKILTFFEAGESNIIRQLRSMGVEVRNLSNENLLTIPFPYDGTLIYNDEEVVISDYDLVLILQRGRIATTLYELLSPHTKVIGNPVSRDLMNDKVRTAITLDNAGIPVAESLYSTGYVDTTRASQLSEWIVEKPYNGKSGVGTVLHKDGLKDKVSNKIIQRYVDCGGKDERWIIVAGEVVCAERRSSTNPEKEFRSSLTLGGSGEPIPVTEEMKELGRRVFACFPGCVYTGIDVFRENDEMIVGECNAFPMNGVIEITGHNFYLDICNYIISQIPVKEND